MLWFPKFWIFWRVQFEPVSNRNPHIIDDQTQRAPAVWTSNITLPKFHGLPNSRSPKVSGSKIWTIWDTNSIFSVVFELGQKRLLHLISTPHRLTSHVETDENPKTCRYLGIYFAFFQFTLCTNCSKSFHGSSFFNKLKLKMLKTPDYSIFAPTNLEIALSNLLPITVKQKFSENFHSCGFYVTLKIGTNFE